MKIVRAMKEVSRLQGEVKDIKSRMHSCISTMVENDFEEEYGDLKTQLAEKTNRIIMLKNCIMQTNVKHGMFESILNLGELKSYIAFLRELEIKKGFHDDGGFRSEKSEFKSQMSLSEKNAIIEKCQNLINSITDKLDEFNVKTDIEDTGVTVTALP